LRNRSRGAGAALLSTLLFGTFGAHPAAAQPPAAAALLAEVGFSPAQIAQVEKGQLVAGNVDASSERELVAGFAFLMPRTPEELVAEARQGLLDRVDPNTLAFAILPQSPGIGDFAKLTLAPDPTKQAQAYVSAKPGGGLNLSSAEIATMNALGSGASAASVEQAVRSALLARVQAYQAQGLAGIAPYALAGGKVRSPADELRSASQAAKRLQKYIPAAYQMLLDYPKTKAPGTQETFRWTRYMAHGVPTISLTHSLFVPDGDAWLAVQRQYYVSAGYNSEQAIAAFLPVKGGTIVFYTNRTSTDQVTGFGGSAKRSIGSKMLASQLEALYQKAADAVKKTPG
jgi:hypothetical protein